MSSNTIDERIVDMQFNNRQFESGVRESVGSLEKLKKGLQLDDATRSLSGLSAAGRHFDLSGIANGVQTIASKFSALGIMGVTALANITNAAVNTGKRIVSALTIDPIKTGYNEYELKMNAIQTMMAGSGESLETVNTKLAELNEYSDQTIYSFSDMTQNIGKFTNAGVKLNDAVQAIKGISNEAALSGANANEAARAMYNISQAMSMGYVQLIDWKSIEMANMATVSFKEQLLKTAVAAGTVKKTAKGMYVTPKGTELNMMAMFKDGLQDQWMTSKVLVDTLKEYASDTTAIGKKAFQAATEIKTLTQMYGVLKESAQSGWSQSWEIIAGNFDEGKSLFTALNKFIGGFISKSAKARNEMLQFWKDNGGRDELISAFKDLAYFAGEVLKPIKEGLQTFFPPKTGKDLVAFTKGIKAFTEKLILSGDTIDKIKRIFTGLSAGLDIVKQFFVAAFKGLGMFAKVLAPAGDGLLEFLARIGDWLVELDQYIWNNDLFLTAVEKMAAKLSWAAGIAKVAFEKIKVGLEKVIVFLKSFKKVAAEVSTSVKNSFKKIVTSIGNFTGLDFTNLDTFVTTLKEKLAPLAKIGELVEKAVTWIGGLFQKMGIFFGKIGKGIGDFISKMNLPAVSSVVNSGIMATIMVGITKLILSLSKVADSAGGFLKGITSIFDGVKGCLKAWQQDLKAEVLKKIAISILILAGALLIMSLIDTNKLTGALAAITVLFTELFGSMAVFDKIVGSSGFQSMGRVTRAMILLSVAVLLLAKAAEILGGLNWDALAVGMTGVTALIGLLIGASKLMEKTSGSLIKSSAGLILFALAIRLLVESVEALAQLSVEQLAKGLTSVLLLCGMLVGMMAASKLGGMSPKDAAGFLILAVALRILASAVNAFGSMKPEVMVQGLWALTIVLAELAVFIWLVDEKQMAAMGAGLLVLAASMIIFAIAIKMLGSMPFNTLAKGLLGMAAALGMVVLAVRLMPPNMVQIGIGMLAISVGLLLIAKAMQMIGSMSAEQIVKGIVGLGLALTMIVIAVNAVQGAILGAVALVIVTAALLGLAVVMGMIGAMPIEAIGKALLAIALVLIILGGAAAILTPILPSMLLLGAALIVMGIGLAAVGAAALILSIGLGALSVAGLAGVGILLAIGVAMIPLVVLTPAILAVGAALLILSIGVLAVGLALSMLGMGLGMIVALGEPGMAALLLLASTAVQISQFALELLAAGAGLLLFGAGAILAGAGAILAGLGIFVLAWGLKSLAKVDLTQFGGLLKFSEDLLASALLLLLSAPGLLASGAALVVFGAGANSTGEGISKITMGLLDLTKLVVTLPGIIEKGIDVITGALNNMINSMIKFIESKKPELQNKFDELVTSSVDKMNNREYLFFLVGVRLVDGFIAGIKSRSAAAIDEAVIMALATLNAANKALEIHSPSGKFELVGKNANKGLAKGLKKYASLSTNAAADMAESTIRPVMSMSQARSSSVNFGSRQTASVAAIATEVQNRSPYQKQEETTPPVNPPTELTGVLTVQVKNDKGEIIGLAQAAVKDLLRKESR